MKDVDRLFSAFLFGLFIGLMAQGTSKFLKVAVIGDLATERRQGRDSDSQSDTRPSLKLEPKPKSA